MGWANCGTDDDGRPIGYAFAATCDQPGCDAQIDRGLSYVCGSMHGGGVFGCGRYFCGKHLYRAAKAEDHRGQHWESLCDECYRAWESAQSSADQEA